jgi:Spy/CpxP family protein refolding chaperone
MLLLLAATLLAAAMMTVAMMAATATSAAFAQETGEESCGTSNPKIDSPAGPPWENKKKGNEFKDCGFRNNPNEEKGFPSGQYK